MVTEVDAVGTQRENAAIEIGIENLMRQGDPSAGRSASEHACPRFSDHPELGFDQRDQLLHDRVAEGTVVCRVHTVRIVVVRRWMLHPHVDRARLRARGRRRLRLAAAAGNRRGEMSVVVDDWILHGRMLLVAIGQLHDRAEKNRMAPPFRQDVALDLQVLHRRGIGRRRDRRNHLVGDECDGRR